MASFQTTNRFKSGIGLLLIAFLLTATGCGKKGALYLEPEKDAEPPVAAQPQETP